MISEVLETLIVHMLAVLALCIIYAVQIYNVPFVGKWSVLDSFILMKAIQADP